MIARARAIHPPVTEAVRVPPSASRMSQSTITDLAPRRPMSMPARRDRPMSRWISWVRPPAPLRSRLVRVEVDLGRRLYSAVTHPWGGSLFSSHLGTPSETVAVHSTLVRPMENRTDSGAWSMNPVSTFTSLRSLTERPSMRVICSPPRLPGLRPPQLAGDRALRPVVHRRTGASPRRPRPQR